MIMQTILFPEKASNCSRATMVLPPEKVGRQQRPELEKLDLAAGTLSLEDGVKEAARIIYVAHEDSKDKEIRAGNDMGKLYERTY